MESKHVVYDDYTKSKPHSFGGKFRSYKQYKNTPKHIIDDTFDSIDVYTKFKPFRKLRYYNPTYVYNRREKFQMDTVFLTSEVLVEANAGKKYLLCIMDIFTKKAWCYANEFNNCETVVKCLKDLFAKIDKPPKNLCSDQVICNFL